METAVIITSLAQKSHDACLMSLRVPYDYLKSLRSFFGPKGLSKMVRCLHNQGAMPVRGLCDLPAMYLRATGLCLFKNLSSAELNKIVEATMTMNLYDNCRVFLRWPHENDDLDIVRAL